MVQEEGPSREHPSHDDVTGSPHGDPTDENPSSRDRGKERWSKKDYDNYYLSLGVALQDYKMRNFQECIPLFQELLENPVVKSGRAKAVNILTHLAHSFYGTGEKEKAKEYFTNAIQLDPNNEMAHYGLYCLYEEQQDFEEALKNLRTVAEEHLNESYINELVDFYIKQEREDEATRFLEQKEKDLSAKNPEKHAALIQKLKERRVALTGIPDKEKHEETVGTEGAEDEVTPTGVTPVGIADAEGAEDEVTPTAVTPVGIADAEEAEDEVTPTAVTPVGIADAEEAEDEVTPTAVTPVGIADAEEAEDEVTPTAVTPVGTEGAEETVGTEGAGVKEEPAEEKFEEPETQGEKVLPVEVPAPEISPGEASEEKSALKKEEEPKESKEEMEEDRARARMEKEWVARVRLERKQKEGRKAERFDIFFREAGWQKGTGTDKKTGMAERQKGEFHEEKEERKLPQDISKLRLHLIKEKIEELEGEREQLKRRGKQLEDQARLNALKEEELEALRKQLGKRKNDILALEKKSMEKIKHVREMMKEERGRLSEKEKSLLEKEEGKMGELSEEREGKQPVPERTEEYQKDVKEALESSPKKEIPPQPTREFRSKEAESLFLNGNHSFRERLYESAISLYRKALQLEPDVAEIWNNMGVAFDEMGMTTKARLCYDEAIKLEERYCDAYLNKGYNLLKNKLYESALAAFEKVQEITPSIEEAKEYSEFCKIKLGSI